MLKTLASKSPNPLIKLLLTSNQTYMDQIKFSSMVITSLKSNQFKSNNLFSLIKMQLTRWKITMVQKFVLCLNHLKMLNKTKNLMVWEKYLLPSSLKNVKTNRISSRSSETAPKIKNYQTLKPLKKSEINNNLRT